MNNLGHVLYKTGDPDAPEEIKDRNGDVVLELCRRCGKAEIELSEDRPMTCIDTTDLIKPLFELYSLEEVGEWLNSPHPMLGGKTATEMIATGHQDQVKAAIDALVNEVYI